VLRSVTQGFRFGQIRRNGLNSLAQVGEKRRGVLNTMPNLWVP